LEFIENQLQVRVSVPFHGRQLAHKEFGYQLIAKLLKDLGELVKVDLQPKFVGRKLITTLSPK